MLWLARSLRLSGAQRSGAQHLDDSATLTARRIRTDHTAAAHSMMRRSRVARHKPSLPLPTDLDEIVSIGSVAVEKDDQPLGLARARREPRTGEGWRHQTVRLARFR